MDRIVPCLGPNCSHCQTITKRLGRKYTSRVQTHRLYSEESWPALVWRYARFRPEAEPKALYPSILRAAPEKCAQTPNWKAIVRRALGELRQGALLYGKVKDDFDHALSMGLTNWEARWIVRASRGICGYCWRKAIPGKGRCRAHYDYNRANCKGWAQRQAVAS